MNIEWQRLWEHVTREFQCAGDSIHGPGHWRRVERNGLLVATRSGAVVEVVRLFAVFHDSRREHDDWDDTHGARGAAYAASLRGVLFDLSDEHFKLLHYACTWHTHGRLSNQPTIGTCWDADRLDLGRVGILPEAAYMSTEFGREIAAQGSVESYLQTAGGGMKWEGAMGGDEAIGGKEQGLEGWKSRDRESQVRMV
jgi:uncharacterized protein